MRLTFYAWTHGWFTRYPTPCPQAIEGYRETEKSQWWEENWAVIDRLRTVTTTSLRGRSLTPLPAVHVLELAADGYGTQSMQIQWYGDSFGSPLSSVDPLDRHGITACTQEA